MHNIKEIRKDLDFFKKKISERNSSINFDDLIIFDKENRDLIQQKEKKEQEKKLLSKLKDSTNFEKSKKLSNEIDKIAKKQNILHNKISTILSNIPNVALSKELGFVINSKIILLIPSTKSTSKPAVHIFKIISTTM